ncbi:MAG: hypothetical protein QM614_14340, partial [Ottowia sp.]
MRARRSRSLSWLLPLALLAAQWLALAHGVLHVRGAAHPGAVAVLAQPPAHAGHGWLDRLFGDHGSSADCRLYDQSAGGDQAPGAAAVDLPVGGPPQVPPRWVRHAW